MYKGIEKNQNYTRLICAAQNMKNIENKITNSLKRYGNSLENFVIFIKNIIFTTNLLNLKKS